MKNSNPSQESQILEHFKNGLSLTAYGALTKFNCFRLASRVHALRKKGHEIESDWYDVPGGKKVKRYFLKGRDMLK